MDVKILPGQMINATNGAVHENAPDFWECALRKLGHVSIFAFATGEFMLVGPGGERVRAGSLTAALQEMLNCLGFDRSGREEGD
ncbi:MAG: hypothetical protein V4793_25665 [Paraburkholderia tropica]|uniref:hypothetical protein n=1 Tax=Paraburkholderia tropica TaxID=92647 RepID=UPI002AB7897B|nr:hypothetical protein [Paraburkholderia tropica]